MKTVCSEAMKLERFNFQLTAPYSPRAQVVLFLDSRPSIKLILYKANMSTDYENQSLIKIYFNNDSESKMAAKMAAKICGFTRLLLYRKIIHNFS